MKIYGKTIDANAEYQHGPITAFWSDEKEIDDPTLPEARLYIDVLGEVEQITEPALRFNDRNEPGYTNAELEALDSLGVQLFEKALYAKEKDEETRWMDQVTAVHNIIMAAYHLKLDQARARCIPWLEA